MDSESSDIDFIITTRRHRFIQFCKVYWRTITFLIAPLLLLPIAFVGSNNAYKCFYIFILTNVFWILDVVHPSVTSLVPIPLVTIMNIADINAISQIFLRNILLDTLGIIMVIVAIEHSNIHRRVALKFLLIFGCSHYRLSFFLFFITMFLSMWISNTIACGLMMPFVKSILIELERMGLLEVYETIDKEQQTTSLHEHNIPRPTEFTVFYFLGIAYSASIGSIATISGSPTNKIFKMYTETIFTAGPNLEFPQFLLLNLPGVLVMETLVCLWLNFFFLGMFRIQSDLALQTGLTEEEALYIKTLLASNYENLDDIDFHEITVGLAIILTIVFQTTITSTYLDDERNFQISSPCMIAVMFLFAMPINLNFIRYFKKHRENAEFLPTAPTKSCLNWKIVQNHMQWSVLFITVSSSTIFEALKYSGMTLEIEKFLSIFETWPASMTVMIVILLCKILTECANDVCVVYCILPHIARLSVQCKIHPHYMMMAATLSGSLSFHLLPGNPINAMVASYVHIPVWRMMYAGIGPTIIVCIINWFTVAVWSKAIWTDINIYPKWAETYVFDNVWVKWGKQAMGYLERGYTRDGNLLATLALQQ